MASILCHFSIETTVLGGTAQDGDFNLKTCPNDSTHIRTGCLSLDPSLANSTLKREWVGLRPGRDTVRIEEETMKNKGSILSNWFRFNHCIRCPLSINFRKRKDVHSGSRLRPRGIWSDNRLGLCIRRSEFGERPHSKKQIVEELFELSF